MLENLSRTKRNLGLLAIAFVVGWAAWSIRAVINPLILGYLLAFILQPAVERLQARGLQRSGAVLTVFGLAFLGTLLLGLGVLYQGRVLIDDLAETEEPVAALESPAERTETASPAEQPAPEDAVDADRGPEPAPDGPQEAAGPSESVPEPTGRQRLESVRGWLEERLGSEWVPPALSVDAFGALVRDSSEARQVAEKAGIAAASSLWGALTRFFGGVFGLSALLLMVPVYAFFWLFEMARLNEYVRLHLPVRHRDRLVSLFERLGEVLSVFFRGRLTVCLLKGLFLTVALVLGGIPYALLLGLGGGFLSIIPFLGGVAAFAGALLVALSAHGLVYAVVVTGLIFAAAELIEGYVLMPRILGDSLGLTDVTVLFAITAGGASLGLMGVLLALPLAAAIKILYVEFVEPALEQFVEEDESAEAPG